MVGREERKGEWCREEEKEEQRRERGRRFVVVVAVERLLGIGRDTQRTIRREHSRKDKTKKCLRGGG